MMIFCFLFSFSYSLKYYLRGDWIDTSLEAESECFFNDLFPSYYKQFKSFIENGFNYESIDEYINDLKNKTDIPRNITDLLRFCLFFKVYHFRAAQKTNTNDRKVIFRNWGLVRTSSESVKLPEEFPEYLSSALENVESFHDKIELLRKYTSSPSDFLQEMLGKDIKFKKRDASTSDQFININGCNSKFDSFIIASQLIREIKTSLVNKNLGIKSSSFLHKNTYRRPFYYTHNCLKTYDVHHHTLLSELGKQSTHFDLRKDSYNLLKFHKLLVKVQFFCRIDSPLLLPVITYVENVKRFSKPFVFNFIIFGNLNNKIEELAIKGFLQVSSYAGGMHGVNYLKSLCTRGLTKNSVKRAYKLMPNRISWKMRKEFLKDKTINETAHSYNDYVKKHNITDFAVSVNGEFFFDNPPFEFLDQRILMAGERIRYHVKNNEIIDVNNISEWYRNNSIEIDALEPPFVFNISHRVLLDHYSVTDITDAVNILYSQVKSDQFPVHVLHDVDIEPDDGYSVFKVREFPKIYGEPKIVIGPFKFNEILTRDQIIFIKKYVEYVYMYNELVSYSFPQRIFILLWRSNEHLHNRERESIPVKPVSFGNQNIDSLVTIYVNVNPSTTTIWETLDVIKQIENCSLISIEMFLNSRGKSLPFTDSIVNYQYFSACDNGYVDIDNFAFISYPKSMPLKFDGNGFAFVPGLIIEGYSQHKVVIFDDNIRYTDSNGYFAGIIRPMKYDFCVIPYISSSLIEVRTDFSMAVENYEADKFAFFVFCWNTNLYNTRNLLYSLLTHTSEKIDIYIINPFQHFFTRSLEIYVLPFFQFINQCPSSNTLSTIKSFKFIYPKYLFPSEIRRLLFIDESVLVFNDVGKLNKIDMKGCEIAAIERYKRSLNYDDISARVLRADHPLLSHMFLLFDLQKYSSGIGAEWYMKLFNLRMQTNTNLGNCDEEYLTLLQLHVQTMILPEQTVFCHSDIDVKYSKSAFFYTTCRDNHIFFPESYKRIEYEAPGYLGF